MKVLGISPLDKDATVALVEDGRLVFAAAEERYSRVKQHAGFPHRALEDLLERTATDPRDLDAVAYAFLPPDEEARRIREGFAAARRTRWPRGPSTAAFVAAARRRVPQRRDEIPGLEHPNACMPKGPLKECAYRLLGAGPLDGAAARLLGWRWRRRALAEHRRFARELEEGLAEHGIGAPIVRLEHHAAHAACAAFGSGFDPVLAVTIDGYGSGLSGAVALRRGPRVERLARFRFPHSLGALYEAVTSSLGFVPDRHAGKVVGLAAHGDPEILLPLLRARVRVEQGEILVRDALNVFHARYLAARLPRVDVAAAYQAITEEAVRAVVAHWVRATGCRSVALAGGVAANVKLNQRVAEVEEVERLFVYPNMGDGGLAHGAALLLAARGRREREGSTPLAEPFETTYLGPDYPKERLRRALEEAGLPFEEPPDPEAAVARLLAEGRVVARFDGRMEYGPRALGHRSIFYPARDPEVNRWLNRRLGRTEFMPFAPVVLEEDAAGAFVGLSKARRSAAFMTVTFDCSHSFRASSPAAVHVDGTARPQVLARGDDPAFHRLLEEYRRLTGLPALVNTSFNMHEEPIVATPEDAIRAYQRGALDALQLGPFVVLREDSIRRESGGSR